MIETTIFKLNVRSMKTKVFTTQVHEKIIIISAQIQDVLEQD